MSDNEQPEAIWIENGEISHAMIPKTGSRITYEKQVLFSGKYVHENVYIAARDEAIHLKQKLEEIHKLAIDMHQLLSV